jgi:hypothetical protein
MLEFAKRESARAVTENRRALEARLEKIRVEEEKQRHATEHPGEPRKRQVCLPVLDHKLLCTDHTLEIEYIVW